MSVLYLFSRKACLKLCQGHFGFHIKCRLLQIIWFFGTVASISQNQSYHIILTVITNIRRTRYEDSSWGVPIHMLWTDALLRNMNTCLGPGLIIWIETGGGQMWMRCWTFGFHKTWRISWLTGSRLAAQEWLCSMELVSDVTDRHNFSTYVFILCGLNLLTPWSRVLLEKLTSKLCS